MNKDVIISIKGMQTSDNLEESKMELITEGKYYKKGESVYVTYKESEVTGMEGTTTTIKIKGDMVTLMRFGTVNSQFVFERGQKHLSYYDTQYGSFTIGVFTNNMEIDLQEFGGEIRVGYQLDIDNSSTGYNDFRMTIREAV